MTEKTRLREVRPILRKLGAVLRDRRPVMWARLATTDTLVVRVLWGIEVIKDEEGWKKKGCQDLD